MIHAQSLHAAFSTTQLIGALVSCSRLLDGSFAVHDNLHAVFNRPLAALALQTCIRQIVKYSVLESEDVRTPHALPSAGCDADNVAWAMADHGRGS